MDKRKYKSETVKQWCHDHKVCDEGRDLAVERNDLASVWWALPRPGWLMWFYREQITGDVMKMEKSSFYDACNNACLATARQYAMDDFHSVDVDWCDAFRESIDCPFASDPVAECTAENVAAVASAVHNLDDDGSRDVADWMVNGDKDALIRHKDRMIAYGERQAKHYRRLFEWSLIAAYIAILFVFFALNRFRREDDQQC